MALFSRKSKAKIPVIPQEKSFIETTWKSLSHHFGSANEHPVVYPSRLKVPDTGDREAMGRLLFRFVCKHLDIDPETLELDMFFQGNAGVSPTALVHFEGGNTLGSYQHKHRLMGKPIVHLNLEALKTVEMAVNVISVQVSRAKLIAESNISLDHEEHEYLAEIAAIYFGFGIFQANTSLVKENWAIGEEGGSIVTRAGHLPRNMIGYTLGLQAYLQDSRNPDWLAETTREQRKFAENSLIYLFQTQDCEVEKQ